MATVSVLQSSYCHCPSLAHRHDIVLKSEAYYPITTGFTLTWDLGGVDSFDVDTSSAKKYASPICLVFGPYISDNHISITSKGVYFN